MLKGVSVFKRKNPDQTLYPFTRVWEWRRPFSEDLDLSALDERYFDAVRKKRPTMLRWKYIESERENIERLLGSA